MSKGEVLERWGSFASKIRGATLSDKLEQMILRYKKVVNDSEVDNTYYRISFSKAHQETLFFLESALYDKFTIQEILNHLIDAGIAKINISDDIGFCDGYGIIAAEAIRVLEDNNE